jgi:hypothetical protein
MTVNPKPAENIRMEYHVSRLFVSQETRGQDRFLKDLKPTYHLSIIGDHTIFTDKAWAHRFEYYDPVRNITLGGRTAILVVELSKLDEVVKKPPVDMSRQERWAVYFGYYTDTGKQGLLREIEALEEGIKMAETVVKGFTKEQLEYIHETYRILQEMDWNEYLYEMKEKAKEEGLFIGKEEGIALGKEEGIALGKEEGISIGKEEGIALGEKSGSQKLIDLLENGKSLEEAKRILGIE